MNIQCRNLSLEGTMAEVKGIEGLSMDEVRDELARGAKFVVFPYCISVVIMTFRRSSDIHFLRKGEVAFTKGWSFALVSLFLGWWGFPWGLVYTPIALFQTLAGGKDVTQEVWEHCNTRIPRRVHLLPRRLSSTIRVPEIPGVLLKSNQGGGGIRVFRSAASAAPVLPKIIYW